MTPTLNSFKLKSRARRVARDPKNAPFSPFAIFTFSDSNRRRNTMPNLSGNTERDLEAGLGGAPISHAQTAPVLPNSQPSTLQTNTSNGGATIVPESDEYVTPNGATEKIGERSLGSQGSSSANADGVKNRRVAYDARLGSSGADEPDDSHKNESEKKEKEHRLFKNVHPKEPFTVRNQVQRVFLSSWINILLIAAPVGIALNYTDVDPIAIFVVNFIAIIPLAAWLGFATEEIALRTGETLGGLLNATFGNAVELIVAIMALVKNEVVIVQTSLIGSVLSNLLLVMGMCFFFGGLRRREQFFNTTVAQTAASLLALAVSGVIVPTVFDAASITSQADVASLSRGTAVILLIVYAAYLFFQLKTHHAVFSEESQKVPAKPFKSHLQRGAIKSALVQGPASIAMMKGMSDPSSVNQRVDDMVESGSFDDDDEEEPQLHFYVALGLLTGATVLIALCAEFLVDSIDYVTSNGGISKEFLGLILLPIVGNAAEHATAVTVAIKDKMDLAIGVAVGSSMQVSLFLIPLLVVIGWGMGIDEMSLSFDIFQVAVMFVAVLLVNYLIADGKSHWLEGMLLMCLYCIIAVCSWWYPA